MMSHIMQMQRIHLPKELFISDLICTGFSKKKIKAIMKRIMLLMVVTATFMVSCESRTYADISVPVANPTYEANVKPVINANCSTSGCHNQGATFPPLTNYLEVKGYAT